MIFDLKRFLQAVVVSLGLSQPLSAQSWPNLDQLLFSTLTSSGTAEASFWIPDSPDPAGASRALGVVYEYIQGSAGSVSIAVGHYVRTQTGWQFAGTVSGLFGNSPRDPAYEQGFVDLTTTTLGPNEPRCCPTVQTRWRINLNTLTAVKLP